MSRPPVDVRRAGVEDLDDLLSLWGRARDEVLGTSRAVTGTSPEHLRPRMREVLEGHEVQVLLARHLGEAVGYAILRVAPVFAITDGPCLHVEHLFVTPPARHRGVARALLSGVASVAERAGADQVITSVVPSARETHRFLARLGFAPFVVRRVALTAVLRRKLAGETSRGAVEDLLSRRRSRRGRAIWSAVRAGGAAPATVLDVVSDTALDVVPDAALDVVPSVVPRPAGPDRTELDGPLQVQDPLDRHGPLGLIDLDGGLEIPVRPGRLEAAALGAEPTQPA